MGPIAPGGGRRDRLGRPLRDLRISVTDRCNFRCPYCMPAEVFGKEHPFLPRDEILTFEEIARFAAIAAAHGVTKVRLTGGEPLLRREIERLVAMIRAIDGIEDVALTTNGLALAARARVLAAAGLGRVTVSLDSIDPGVFQAMNGVGVAVDRVLEGIAAAKAAGLEPIKLNTVVRRGVNDGGIVELARFGRDHGHTVRFIEFMDVGTTNRWRLEEVVPAAEIVEVIGAVFPLVEAAPGYPGEVARRYSYADGGGEIGVIASVTQPFCQGCTRARLTAEGRLFTCLFAAEGHDVRSPLRAGDDAAVEALLARVWGDRVDRYSEDRALVPAGDGDRIEMSYVGG